MLRVAGAQIENVVGDLEGNARRIVDAMRWAEAEHADVLVLPELALTGYPLEDLVLRDEFVAASGRTLRRVARHAGSTVTVVGTTDVVPEQGGGDTRRRNVAIAAALLSDGEVRGVYHKILLPNYDVFDEARNFAAGRDPGVIWRIGDVVAGVAICEDAWSGDGPPEMQAANGAQILLLPNASPFHHRKPEGRRDLVSALARRNGVPVVYVNCVGGQDDLVFDGGSLVADARGEVVFRAEQFRPSRFVLDLEVPVARPLAVRPRIVHTRTRIGRAPVPPPPSPPQLDPLAQAWEALVLGIRDYASRNAFAKVVFGVSGGIDSAVCAAVATDAVGPENVLGVAMPSSDSPSEELEDARELAARLGIGFEVIPIGPVIRAGREAVAQVLAGQPARSTSLDLEARARGTVLMGISDELGYLALAAGNRTELSIGTGVLYGDMAGGFAPLKDCPKTMLYSLARHRNETRGPTIPERILDRVPSSQRNDNETPPYGVLDQIVERYVDLRQGIEEIVRAGFEPGIVRGVLQLVDRAEFKRRQTPPGVKITARAFGSDRRMPITNAWQPFPSEATELAPGLGVRPGPDEAPGEPAAAA